MTRVPVLQSFSAFKILEAPKTQGVYSIECAENGFIYIGSTTNERGFRERFRAHVYELCKGKHSSKWLQRDWKEFGEHSFTFGIIEICDPTDCLRLEQKWINAIGAGQKNRCYNSNRVIQESKKKRQYSAIDPIKETVFIVTPPSGVDLIINDLPGFCISNGLSYKALMLIAKGYRYQTHDGWKCRFQTEPEIVKQRKEVLQGKNKSYIVTHPDGNEEIITGLPEFCEKHNLCPSTMTKVVKGKHLHHKGFRIRYADETWDDRLDKLKDRKNNREYIVIDPQGNVYENVKSLTEFAKLHNLTSHRRLEKCARGESLNKPGQWQCRVAWETEDDLARKSAYQKELRQKRRTTA